MNAITDKIHVIERLSGDEAATVNLLDKVIASLLENDLRKLEQFRRKLSDFEAQYDMKTHEFQRQFNSGALGDDADWFEWDAIADMVQRLEDKLAQFDPFQHA